MLKEAEQFAEEDKKAKERIDARNKSWRRTSTT